MERVGLPRELILSLRDRFGLRLFVECGTYRGDTAVWAASHFERVITIEASEKIYEITSAKHGKIGNIKFLYGDSRAVLPTILPSLVEPTIIWLDSHWSGGNTYGEKDECPLLEELALISSSPQTHFLFIDDARMFMSPPPYPHQIDAWPTIDLAIEAIKRSGKAYYIVCFGDVIVAVPKNAQEIVRNYCCTRNTLVRSEQENLIKTQPAIKRYLHAIKSALKPKRRRIVEVFPDEKDAIALLRSSGLLSEGRPLRLHLGCGEGHLDGYINIDYPPADHTVQRKSGADIFADIMMLQFPEQVVDEVRSHHVFEHFNRARALALCIKWHEWLKIGGILHIETPDLMGSARQVCSALPYKTKQAIVRHLFGSHEAHWAYHYDGWYAEKFQLVLSLFGFSVECRSWQWEQEPYLSNVEAVATKKVHCSRQQLLHAADSILLDSTVADSRNERRLHEVWCQEMRQFI